METIKKEKQQSIEAIIKKAVNAGIQAGHIVATQKASDTYKATEKRLYAYPTLLEKIDADKEMLMHIIKVGAPERSKSIMRHTRSGSRLTPDEIIDTLVKDSKATIASDEHETDTITAALASIANDPYYAVIEGRYIHGQHDDEIADAIPCDPTTVRRNRGRLVRKLAIRLYGTQAL